MSARILVVDDIPANVKLLEARLSAEYFDVLTAGNGTEALKMCQRAECDMILLDVMMPDMDGFEVCRRIKSDPLTHHIPVVMVTALDSPAAALGAPAGGEPGTSLAPGPGPLESEGRCAAMQVTSFVMGANSIKQRIGPPADNCTSFTFINLITRDG